MKLMFASYSALSLYFYFFPQKITKQHPLLKHLLS